MLIAIGNPPLPRRRYGIVAPACGMSAAQVAASVMSIMEGGALQASWRGAQALGAMLEGHPARHR